MLRVTVTEESGGRKGSDGHKVRRESFPRLIVERVSHRVHDGAPLTQPRLPSCPLQIQLLAVMVTHYNIRMAVYAQQAEDFSSNRLGDGGGT